MKKWWLSLCMIVCSIVLVACTETTEPKDETKIVGEQVDLVQVIDGDTMKIKYKGNEEKVRFLLIDAPEMHHATLGEQPFGKQAQQRNKELIENANVLSIEFDETGDREDKYGRLLAYVFVDGKSVQQQLIREGLVRVGYVYNKQAKYIQDYYAAQDEAKGSNRGIWQYDGYVTNRGFVKAKVPGWRVGDNPDKNGSLKEVVTEERPQTEPTTSKNETSSTCDIKGNINAKGAKHYFLRGTNNYDHVKEEKMFCSEEQAKKEGFEKAS